MSSVVSNSLAVQFVLIRKIRGFSILSVLLHVVDALAFRGRSLVLRKEQRILVFIVLNRSSSAFLAEQEARLI